MRNLPLIFVPDAVHNRAAKWQRWDRQDFVRQNYQFFAGWRMPSLSPFHRRQINRWCATLISFASVHRWCLVPRGLLFRFCTRRARAQEASLFQLRERTDGDQTQRIAALRARAGRSFHGQRAHRSAVRCTRTCRFTRLLRHVRALRTQRLAHAPARQILIVCFGCGYVQSWGEPIQVIRPGDVGAALRVRSIGMVPHAAPG